MAQQKKNIPKIPYHYTDLKKMKYNTWYFKDATEAEHIRLYDTCIIIKYKDRSEVKLDSGGFKTATTKNRINEFLPMFFDSDWKLIQKKGIWYLRSESLDKEILFSDNMRLHFNHKTKNFNAMSITYVKIEKQHPGQTDSPASILKDLLEWQPEWNFIFAIDNINPYETFFSVYRYEEKD